MLSFKNSKGLEYKKLNIAKVALRYLSYTTISVNFLFCIILAYSLELCNLITLEALCIHNTIVTLPIVFI